MCLKCTFGSAHSVIFECSFEPNITKICLILRHCTPQDENYPSLASTRNDNYPGYTNLLMN